MLLLTTVQVILTAMGVAVMAIVQRRNICEEIIRSKVTEPSLSLQLIRVGEIMCHLAVEQVVIIDQHLQEEGAHLHRLQHLAVVLIDQHLQEEGAHLHHPQHLHIPMPHLTPPPLHTTRILPLGQASRLVMGIVIVVAI